MWIVSADVFGSRDGKDSGSDSSCDCSGQVVKYFTRVPKVHMYSKRKFYNALLLVQRSFIGSKSSHYISSFVFEILFFQLNSKTLAVCVCKQNNSTLSVYNFMYSRGISIIITNRTASYNM
jgi:hypothetical protein